MAPCTRTLPAPRRPSLPDAGEDSPLDALADFPAIPAGWAYLDTAATAQKPQAGDRRDHPRL